MNSTITTLQKQLQNHPLYKELSTIDSIRLFMKYHAFAVWDFMSLLKSLQRQITTVTLPWQDSKFDPELVRLINEIVLGEESDLDKDGKATSHFSLYCQSMSEIGADQSLLNEFLQNLDLSTLPDRLKSIISFHLDLSLNGKVHEVASSFFYGREKLIPTMFEEMVVTIKNSKVNCPTLIYYLERHIEVDGGEHGPKAESCLAALMTDSEKIEEATSIAEKSLSMRIKLWDFVYEEILAAKNKPSLEI